ncbi:MAG: acylphosphatase [Ignavibacteria bacterium]|nr:acylphosphatase [Ignavibacteria bacterium]
MQSAVHIIVKGLVQGVGFRYFVYRKAVSYGLKGFVRNLVNGDVEIVAEGDRSLVEELIKDTKVGPRAAHVLDLKLEWQKPTDSYRDFGMG